MTRGNAARILDQLGTDAHLRKHVSPHALRRTFCTSGLLSGIPLRDMQIAMRHSQSTTTELYDMAAKSLDRNASHRVASFLAGATG
jgi:site-specific recombinase XerD